VDGEPVRVRPQTRVDQVLSSPQRVDVGVIGGAVRRMPIEPDRLHGATTLSVDAATSLDIGTVKAPAYVFAAERDAIKATVLSQLAQSLGAKFTVLPGEGHGIPLNPVWQVVAADIDDWLTGLFG
jgi:hypothetical protein